VKVGVSAQAATLDAAVEPRFGRCPFGIVVDSESMEFDAFENQNTSGSGGAGPRTVQEFVDRGAQTILTGRLGPSAQEALYTSGMEIVTGVSGTVRQAVETFMEGPSARKGVAAP